MPNYEIYPGDVHGILNVLDVRDGPAVVDSTDYQVIRRQGLIRVTRGGLEVGHIKIEEDGQTVFLGRMHVNEAYRGSGVSSLLIFIGLIHGVRGRCSTMKLGEASEQNKAAQMLWARLGLNDMTKTPLQTVLQKFEAAQQALADKLGLARSPWAMLLNTDRPVVSSSSGGEEKKMRRKLSL